MSEYWKSTPKYWCKHCSTYVKDTPFERKQHESTGKHQGNLKRFLRGIQNDHERDERDKQKAKAEVERLNKVVGGSTNNVSSAPLHTQSNGPTRRAGAANISAADQKRQWAQLAEMGIAVPENFRNEMAMPGDWQTISREIDDEAVIDETLNKGVRKRRLNDQEIEEEYAEKPVAKRAWGSSMKKYPGQEPEDDLDALLRGPIPKKNDDAHIKKSNDSFEGDITGEFSSNIRERPDAGGVEIEQSSADFPEATVTGTGSELLVKKEEPENENRIQQTNDPTVVDAPVFKRRKAKAR